MSKICPMFVQCFSELEVGRPGMPQAGLKWASGGPQVGTKWATGGLQVGSRWATSLEFEDLVRCPNSVQGLSMSKICPLFVQGLPMFQ